MKFQNLLILVCVVAFLFISCQAITPNHMHDPVNSTQSGSFSSDDGQNDSNIYDTLSPVQPNGVDTSGAQTGRMSN